MTVRNLTLKKAFPYILVIGGVLGIICSLILINDQIHVWQNPHYVPSCSFNPVISCGSVIDSKQGHVFGIPGPIWGLIAFPVIVTVGATLLAGATLKRWFWRGLQAGIIGGVGFALWLFWLSMYRIHALCPYCLATDSVMYTLFWYITLYNIDQKHIPLPKGRLQRIYTWIRANHLGILILWFLALTALILNHFWYYYGKHL